MVILGKSPFRASSEVFTLSAEDRRRHVYLVGKSGTGKSSLLENLIAQDLEAGQGIAVLDPHGELAERVLELVPKRRINEVVYFNPKDRSNPIPLNLLWNVKPEKHSLVVEGIVTAFKNIWYDSWGPRLEYILTASLAALMEAPKTSLLHLLTLLTDASFREKTLRYVTDPLVQSFFEDFNSWNDRLRQEAIALELV
jgi:type IV secretory pathway VirB4 component